MEFEKILARLHGLQGELEPFREMLLANVVMIGEIPSPTYGEEDRVNFVRQRFDECGLQSSSNDEVGNGLGILTGTLSKKTILVSAHADTIFPASVDHTYSIKEASICGPGVADNSLGLAVLATLPTILEGLGIQLKSDLMLMAATRSLEQGDQQGIRFLLTNSSRPISCGISIEGIPLGRLHYRSMASLGGRINCRIDRKVNQVSAIEVLSRLIHSLGSIELPAESHTGLVLGTVSGGTSYKLPARSASLKFQLRSDTDESVTRVAAIIAAMIDEVTKEEGVSAHLEVIAKTRAGGVDSTHPMVSHSRRVMSTLGIQPQKSIYSATVSGYVEQNVPAICLGISFGDNINDDDEFVEIDPILTGVAQLIGLLLCIDGGNCA